MAMQSNTMQSHGIQRNRIVHRNTPLPFSDRVLDRDELRELQLDRLNHVLERASSVSPYYQKHLPKNHLSSMDELASLPFMDGSSIVQDPESLLNVPAHQVLRMVSIPTSGTTGQTKRIAFSKSDIKKTVGFFEEGIRCIAGEGQLVCVLFPCSTPYSLGQLICEALGNIGAIPIPYGPVSSLPDAYGVIEEFGATSIVGSSHDVLALARWSEVNGKNSGGGSGDEQDVDGCDGESYSSDGGQSSVNGNRTGNNNCSIESVLVSSDNASPTAMSEIGRIWDCEVFEHYGMTETGFGIAVDCHEHDGMHIREEDLLVEIVDPSTGLDVEDGQLGEVVITTLTREAMPLIRYRTGDISSIVPGTCACGGNSRRLGRVYGHMLATEESLSSSIRLMLEPVLDDIVFGTLATPNAIDYSAQARCDGDGRITGIDMRVTLLCSENSHTDATLASGENCECSTVSKDKLISNKGENEGKRTECTENLKTALKSQIKASEAGILLADDASFEVSLELIENLRSPSSGKRARLTVVRE